MTYAVMTLIDDISNDIYLKITHDISWRHIPWHMISWHIPWHMVSVHCTAFLICNRYMSLQCRIKTYVIRYVIRVPVMRIRHGDTSLHMSLRVSTSFESCRRHDISNFDMSSRQPSMTYPDDIWYVMAICHGGFSFPDVEIPLGYTSWVTYICLGLLSIPLG